MIFKALNQTLFETFVIEFIKFGMSKLSTVECYVVENEILKMEATVLIFKVFTFLEI